MSLTNEFDREEKDRIPVAILGGTGYVAGELLRLLAHHPKFAVMAVVSTSQSGDKISAAFPHLAGTKLESLRFDSVDSLTARFKKGMRLGVLAATPHGATASLIDSILCKAEQAGADLHVVDISADFRFQNAETYASIYGKAHPAPQRLGSFTCAPPDLLPVEAFKKSPTPNAAQPGCFTTCVTTGAFPFLALGLAEPWVFASVVTGSSGAGRKLGQGTHHPERRSAMYAYSPLSHRHEPEMRFLLGRAMGGREPEVEFVPHSGPFVRGMHATLRMTLVEPVPADVLRERVRAYFSNSPFVQVSEELPKLTDIAGTNRCALGIAARGKALVVTSVIDNLVKGAAGGGVQWLNRLFNLPDETGLCLPGLGWF